MGKHQKQKKPSNTPEPSMKNLRRMASPEKSSKTSTSNFSRRNSEIEDFPNLDFNRQKNYSHSVEKNDPTPLSRKRGNTFSKSTTK